MGFSRRAEVGGLIRTVTMSCDWKRNVNYLFRPLERLVPLSANTSSASLHVPFTHVRNSIYFP